MNTDYEIILLTQLRNIVFNCSQLNSDCTDEILDSLCRILENHNKMSNIKIDVCDFRKKNNTAVLLSAADARRKVDELRKSKIKSEFNQIINAINLAIENDAYTIIITGAITSANREVFLNMGYNVKQSTGRNETLTSISW